MICKALSEGKVSFPVLERKNPGNYINAHRSVNRVIVTATDVSGLLDKVIT